MALGEGGPLGFAAKGRRLNLLDGHRRVRADDVRAVKVAVSRHHLVFWQPGRRLQRVNILREAAQEFAVVIEQLEEAVRWRRLEVARP